MKCVTRGIFRAPNCLHIVQTGVDLHNAKMSMNPFCEVRPDDERAQQQAVAHGADDVVLAPVLGLDQDALALA